MIPAGNAIELRRAHLLEARRCVFSDPEPRLAWTLWSTAAHVDRLRRHGWGWDVIQHRLGTTKVGHDKALWTEMGERNPDFLATARRIFENEGAGSAAGSVDWGKNLATDDERPR